MKILIVSLLKRKVTPDIPAARPRVIYEIASGLVKKGHDVSLLGTADSLIPGVKIIPVIEKGFVDMPGFENPFYAETAYLVKLAKKIEEIADQFDIIHNHTYPEFINLLIAKNIKTPIISTIHAQAFPEYDEALSLFPEAYHISISEAHKKLFKKAKIFKVIYNGVDTNIYSYQEKKDDYLLWLGRLSKAKNPDGSFMDPKGIKWAIRLAEMTNSRLLMSGNIEDMKFYETDVKPHLTDKIQWVGPLSPELKLTKSEIAGLMQKAKVFLMTINWYEPFGLVMAEAMSCGTPVIGFDRGAVAEIIKDGITGFVIPPNRGIDGLHEALAKIDTIKPIDCRNHIVNNFSTETMVNNYEETYLEILKQ
ncbi:MAG: Glycosyl transferase group 1 [Candidatus Roizmanbacteria bacterium GW2011_GWA2_35_19]|uniref:Glycosyl transferase group 1 n=2 Tax=Candidatus Roizmaniibacteriota TaxID=1752723 RepID=A0A0G0BPY3_9BACT|nr:MAG: Glycosyl transferase group 1 [Candidatus Roizmanbacteria bacterium GW2011_GWC2_35_12]KKP71508.1 MAG: Glycosyl transferase group 1 [Candidatus Roizmanbacteria bacterium GW2011_GWA2_35_19]